MIQLEYERVKNLYDKKLAEIKEFFSTQGVNYLNNESIKLLKYHSAVTDEEVKKMFAYEFLYKGDNRITFSEPEGREVKVGGEVLVGHVIKEGKTWQSNFGDKRTSYTFKALTGKIYTGVYYHNTGCLFCKPIKS